MVSNPPASVGPPSTGADTVDGIHASRTPTAGYLYPLGEDLLFSRAVIPPVLAEFGEAVPSGTPEQGDLYVDTLNHQFYFGSDGVWRSPASGTLPTDMTLPDTQVIIGGADGLGHAQTLSGDASVSNTGVVTLATVTVAKGGTGASTPLTARTSLGVLAPVAGVPTDVPAEGVGTSRLASITRGAQVVPCPYYYAANANDAAANSWWRMDQRFVAGETAIGAFIVED